MKILVLGCGMQGRVAARDLAQAGHRVTILDSNPANLKFLTDAKGIKAMRFDVKEKNQLVGFIKKFDIVLGALPAALGFYAMKSAVDAGIDMVDMSYLAEDPFLLDREARKKGIKIVPDAGFCPGLSNILIGEASCQLGKISRLRVLVGGIPQNPIPPFNYRITWSPADLIAEYTRPARIVKNYKIVTLPALSGIEEFRLPKVGRLECFYTDGLRTLLKTFKNVKNMEEKTIRYPGHARLFKTMIDWGFLTALPYRVKDKATKPDEYTVDFLKSVLSKGDEKDLSILIIEIHPVRDPVPKRVPGNKLRRVEAYSNGVKAKKQTRKYTCVDYYDEKDKITSMARMTAYTGSIITQCIKEYPKSGVIPPEYLGMEKGIADFIRSELKDRKIHIRKSQ